MGFSLVPRNEHFFNDFVQLAEEIRKGARTLKQMLSVDPPDMPKADLIKEMEHACDGLTRSIIDRLNRTFVTPLDREDISHLASALDDVIDWIEEIGRRIHMYHIEEPTGMAQRFERVILDHPTIGLAIMRGLSARLRAKTEPPQH